MNRLQALAANLSRLLSRLTKLGAVRRIRPLASRLRLSRLSFLILAPLAALAVILPNAWIAEDSFISLRVAKNLLAGLGPDWNVGERVQVFTHPLWMGLLTLTEWLFPGGNWVFPTRIAIAVIVLGIICTLTAIVLFMRDIQKRWVIAFTVVIMISSKSFIDYSTSGLENPLLYILVILFAHEYLRKQRVFWLALFASLIALTRADAAALVIPAFIPLLWQHWRERQFWFDILKGAIPLIAWEAFSLFYYGYLLPNTFYAKTFNYLPPGLNDQHAVNYFSNSWSWDKITLPIIVMALLIADLERRHRRRILLVIGIVFYLFLVIRAGGDYMSGRFFAVPFFLSLYLLALRLQEGNILHRLVRPALVAGFLVLALITPQSPVFHPMVNQTNHEALIDVHRGQIADEAEFYCADLCLYNLLAGVPDPMTRETIPIKVLAEAANQPTDHFIKTAQRIKGKRYAVTSNIGVAGYLFDPREPMPYVIDDLALANPLLSHMPADPKSRVGHYERVIPWGYETTVEHGRNLLINGCVHRLYEDIEPVVRGPLVSGQRFKKIIKLNLGITDKKYIQCVRSGGVL